MPKTLGLVLACVTFVACGSSSQKPTTSSEKPTAASNTVINTCTDGVKDGNETGVDCGGSCHACPLGDTCSVASDCLSGLCTNNTCQTPGPQVGTLVAGLTTINSGQSTTLVAVFSGGTGSIDQGIGAVTSGVPVSTGTIGSTTTYTLTVTNTAGVSVTDQVTVTVDPAAAVTSFTSASPTVEAGASTTLTATFAGGNATIDQGIGLITSGQAVSTGNLSTTTSFTLTVVSPTGEQAQQVLTIVVLPEQITSFVAANTTITAGGSTTLVPVFSGGTGAISYGGTILANDVTSGVGITTGALSTSTTYTLTVTDSANLTVTQTVTVTVGAAPTITSFSASTSLIGAGSSTLLTPVFSGGAATISPGLGSVTSGNAISTGALNATTTFTLAVTNAAGDLVEQPLKITVVPLPVIYGLTAAADPVTTGNGTTLTAVFVNGSGSIDHGVGPVTSGLSVATGNLTADTTFTLTVTDPAGDPISQPVTVHTVAAPTISSFTAAAPLVTAGTSTLLTAVFANGTGIVDHSVGAATSGSPVTTGSVSAPTTFTLTVTNAAGTMTTATATVAVTTATTIYGTSANPGASCEQILSSQSALGNGLYWLSSAGSPYQAYCDMTTNGGGYTLFFSDENGSANVFDTFSNTAVDCPDPTLKCLRRLPNYVDAAASVIASCGPNVASFNFEWPTVGYFRNGQPTNGWNNLDNLVGIAGAPVLSDLAQAFSDSTGWILSANADHQYTFANSYGGNNGWDFCNGVTDTHSQVNLMYREAPPTTIELLASQNVSLGAPTQITVFLVDALNNFASTYAGTVHFSSTDNSATLPADYTFTPGDAGMHTFSATFMAATAQLTVTESTQGLNATTQLTTTAGFGSDSNPGYSCAQIQSAGAANGNGLYWMNPTAPMLQSCDMTTCSQAVCGGWTQFFAAYNGAPNVIGQFESPPLPCPDPLHRCMSAPPTSMTPGTVTILASCGPNQISFQPNSEVLAYFTSGRHDSWQSLGGFNLQVINDTTNEVTNWTSNLSFYTGSGSDPGWIISTNSGNEQETFAASYTGNTGWDYCDGQFDEQSPITLAYREAQPTALKVNTALIATPNVPFSFEVVATTPSGSPAVSYAGQVSFTISGGASLPPYTFLPSDLGRHTFVVTIPIGGNQTIAVSDNLSLTASATVQVQVGPGTMDNPGKSCADILRQQSGSGLLGDGLYWINPAGSPNLPYLAECLMDATLNNGGWTTFFVGNNSSSNVFDHFEWTSSDCPDPSGQCLRSIPGEGGGAPELLASCGSNIIQVTMSPAVVAYLQSGVTGQGWQTLTNAAVLAGDAGAANYASEMWTGDGNSNLGFIINGAGTFAGSYDFNTGYDDCDGSGNPGAPLMLAYRSAFDHLEISALPAVAPSTAFSVVVRAVDAAGATFPEFVDTVSFAAPSDGGATLPTNYTFTSADNGSHFFSGAFAFSAGASGPQNLVVTDVDKSGVSATVNINIIPSAPAENTPAASCLAILNNGNSTGDGFYWLTAGSQTYGAWCDMTSFGGGWTLVLKADGTQSTFSYNSPLWINAATLNPSLVDMTTNEAKYPSFSNVGFTQVLAELQPCNNQSDPPGSCGGTGGAIGQVTLAQSANSLQALLSSNAYTLAGANLVPSSVSAPLLESASSGDVTAWLNTLPGTGLQPYCDAEGFNMNPVLWGYNNVETRIGIIANEQSDCTSPDSRLGIGGAGASCSGDANLSVGNVDGCDPNNGAGANIYAFGWVLVR